MITIVVADAHILINGTDRYSLDFEAYCLKDQVGVRHINQKELELFKGREKYDQITLNGEVYASAVALVYAFNAVTAPALSYLLTNLKANSDYPNTPFSARLTPDVETHVANYAFPGYVTIISLSTNAGEVYIGAASLDGTRGRLAPGEKVAYELDDLSTLYALSLAAGYIIDVFGAFRQ